MKQANYRVSLLLAGMMTAVPCQNAVAEAKIEFGEEQYLSVGFGLRGALRVVEGAANDGDRSYDAALDSARLYVAGAVNKRIRGIFTSEKSGANDTVQVIDAAGIFTLGSNLEVWAGRFLSPGSRANLAGPYYSLGGDYWQNIAARYGWNGGTIGRDDGIALVGNVLEQRLVYSFGAFEANKIFHFSNVDAVTDNPQQQDSLMYASRVQYSFWATEPGYYGTGNYLGSKDIFTIGMAYRHKKDGAASAVAVGDYAQFTIDLLIEKQLSGGTASFEAAYFDYDTGDVFLSEQGQAYSAALGYILAESVGWGQLQPYLRYQRFAADNDITSKRTDLGVNYIIDAYNAQIGIGYANLEVSQQRSADSLTLSIQLQF